MHKISKTSRRLPRPKGASRCLLLFAFLFLAACSQYRGIPESQFIREPTPQEWSIAASPDQVWKAVKDIARLEPGSKFLVQSDNDHVLSWMSPKQASRDVLADASAFRTSITFVSTPLTTVWIENTQAPNRCSLHIKRVYLSPYAYSGIGPSRGDYEALFASALRARMPDATMTPQF